MLPYKLHVESDIIVVEILALSLLEGPELDAMSDRLQEELMRSPHKRMVLDCGRLKFMASRAISLIVTISRLARQHKGGLAICGLQAQLLQVFRMAGAERFITINGTRAEAVAGLVEPREGT